MAPQPHTLLVEHDAVVAVAVADFLKQHGFVVDVAAAADRARTRLAAAHHDVMIADLRLGGGDNLDGLDLLEGGDR